VTHLTASLLRIETEAGLRDVVAIISPDEAQTGGISGDAILGAFEELIEAGSPLPHARFTQNPGFVRLLHGVIREHAPASPGLRREAERLGDGWLYVVDRRTTNPEGAVPPEDILGVFVVRGGEAIPASYTPSPNYRLLTEQGFFQLDEHVVPHLLAAVRGQ
jgi:hypothetical protein